MKKSFAEIDKEQGGNYLKLLSAVAKLSGLFSESNVPMINYRAAENIFCRSFAAKNLSRSDTAFDASLDTLGVGLKTFVCASNSSVEKVAEFNSLSMILRDLKGKTLAMKLAEYRNDRIKLANRLDKIDSSLYHIVARREKELLLFETDYSLIDINNISSVKTTKAGIHFHDGSNEYSFNASKSTLYRRFHVPQNSYSLPIDLIEDPYALLLELFYTESEILNPAEGNLIKGVNYIILPLYGRKREVHPQSGLNQWNGYRKNSKTGIYTKRNIGEVYIPIPKQIHTLCPNFLPAKDTRFNLTVPTGEILQAKVCQQGSKALMTNPNKALSDWLLRNILQLAEGELATIEKLDQLGFDSVIITKTDNLNYRINIMKTGSYEEFIN